MLHISICTILSSRKMLFCSLPPCTSSAPSGPINSRMNGVVSLQSSIGIWLDGRAWLTACLSPPFLRTGVGGRDGQLARATGPNPRRGGVITCTCADDGNVLPLETPSGETVDRTQGKTRPKPYHAAEMQNANGLLLKSNRRVGGPGLPRRIIWSCCRPGALTGRSRV